MNYNVNYTKFHGVKKLKKKIIFTLIIILAIVTSVDFISAQNESEYVKASQTGHFNITFDNGYNGYCIDYGDNEAKEGDTFSVENTSYAVNKKSGEDVGNYLKVYFVEYYNEAMKDKIVTQHTIWHFTDDFNGWRLNYTLIDEIKNSSLIIPDHGAVKKINDTTEAIFDFNVFKTSTSGNQNFFGYKITYRDILNNSTINNTNQSTNETTENKTHDIKEKKTDNPITKVQNSIKENSNSKKLSKHITGNGGLIGILALLLLILLITIKYKKR